MAGDVPSSGQAKGQRDPGRPAVPQAQLALYRRYRPATFAQLKGQDHVTEPLRQALRSGRVNHAYLFSGPRGCGKTSSARILARSLNCEQGPTPDPCGECDSCVALAPSGPGSIDVIEIDAASHGGIDDARDLRERAFYSPVAARYKIYIIDEAHMVTGAGFNALLKLVEEPPPHLKFVFATTEPEKVIATIRSRTHHYPFRLVPPAILRELLEEILSAEKVVYEPAVLPVVIRAGAGSVRDSLSVLDQLIAGADESGLRYDRAIALLGYTDDALLDEMAEAFSARDGAAVFRAIDHVVEAGHDPRRFAMDLLDRLRDLIVLAAVPDAAASGLLDVPEDRLERMSAQAAGFGQERLVRAAETISGGLVEMRGATSPRLLLELMCAQVLLPARTPEAGDPSELAARVERLERQLAAVGSQAGTFAAPRTPEPVAESQPQRAQAQRSQPAAEVQRPQAPQAQRAQSAQSAGRQQAPAALDTESLRSSWPEVLDSVREVRKTAWILLSNYATLEAIDGNVLTLAFDTEGNAKGFGSSGSDQVLAELLGTMFGVRLVIRTTVQPASRRSAAADVRGASDGAGASGGAAGGGALSGGAAGGDGALSGGAAGGGTASGDTTGGGAGNGRPASGGAGKGGARDGGTRDGGARDGGARDGGAADGTARVSGQAAPDVGRSVVAGGEVGGADQSGGAPVTGAATRGAAGERGPGARSRRPPATRPDLADDPRPLTDAVPAGSADLTGTDLIMRELGGRVIEESGET